MNPVSRGKWEFRQWRGLQIWDFMVDAAPIGMVSIEKMDGTPGYEVVAAIHLGKRGYYSTLTAAKEAATHV